MGHLRLVADHGLAATLLFVAVTSPPWEQYLSVAASARAEGVDLVALPAPSPSPSPAPDALPATASVRDRIAHAVATGVPRGRSLRSWPTWSARRRARCAVLHVLHLSVDAVLAVPASPAIDDAAAHAGGENRDAMEPIRLPAGCVQIHMHDLPGSMLTDRSSDM
uniref:Uncharacterized protein n=1 Tax=Leersia perrieri TaxID=77586 RepID=A0A0D9V1G4_9ORYZ